jgi:ubiquinone biosynthesis protein UbiJ
MIPKAFSSFVNHLLQQQSWARLRLAAHAGRRIQLRSPPVFPQLPLLVLETGLISVDATAADADLLVSLQPRAIPLLLVHHPDALKHVELSGNAALASVVQELVARLEWDVEEDLSRIVGDIAAHRIATAGRDFLGWQREAFQRTAENLAEYLTEEDPVLLRRTEFDRFTRDLGILGKELDRLEQRFSALMKSTSGTGS